MTKVCQVLRVSASLSILTEDISPSRGRIAYFNYNNKYLIRVQSFSKSMHISPYHKKLEIHANAKSHAWKVKISIPVLDGSKIVNYSVRRH